MEVRGEGQEVFFGEMGQEGQKELGFLSRRAGVDLLPLVCGGREGGGFLVVFESRDGFQETVWGTVWGTV